MYETALKGTQNALKAVNRNVTKKELGKIARGQASETVEPLRSSNENKIALETENILGKGIGELGEMLGQAGKLPVSAKGRIGKFVDKAKGSMKKSNREAAASDMRKKAGELKKDGNSLMTDDYILPYLAKAKYKPWKMFIWPGKHANNLTANWLNMNAWALERSVSVQNWTTRQVLGGKAKLSPYFTNTPLANVTKSQAYWWARITNVTGMGATELPGSWADRKIGLPFQKSERYFDGLLSSRKKGDESTATYTYKITPATSTSGKPAIKVEIYGKGGAAYEGTINAFENGDMFASNKAIGKGFEFLIIGPMKGATYRITDIQGREIVSFKY
jgi:hypothetical protein